ncbi:MAG TPA: helix-turn-helix domain-containing protein [Roseiarcus sp.]|nr:helix-turn-helix domain-containing protein [Roseiarcus sp.]
MKRMPESGHRSHALVWLYVGFVLLFVYLPLLPPLVFSVATGEAGAPAFTLSRYAELARLMPDRQIARLLNRVGVAIGYGNAWTQERVCGFRNHHEIAGYRNGEWAERGEITLEAAAKMVGVCNRTALRMLRRGEIKGRQVCRGAPWAIRTADLVGLTGRKRSDRPLTPNRDQRAFDFQ